MTIVQLIHDINGKVIYAGEHGSLKEAVEYCVRNGISLKKANLQYADLRGAYLRGADLRGVNFRNADLRFADFLGANLEFADFRGVISEGAKNLDKRGEK